MIKINILILLITFNNTFCIAQNFIEENDKAITPIEQSQLITSINKKESIIRHCPT